MQEKLGQQYSSLQNKTSREKLQNRSIDHEIAQKMMKSCKK